MLVLLPVAGQSHVIMYSPAPVADRIAVHFVAGEDWTDFIGFYVNAVWDAVDAVYGSVRRSNSIVFPRFHRASTFLSARRQVDNQPASFANLQSLESLLKLIQDLGPGALKLVRRIVQLAVDESLEVRSEERRVGKESR